LLRKAAENTTKVKSDVNYEAEVLIEDKRDPGTGVYSESSSAYKYSTLDTSMPPPEVASANKEFISCIDIQSELIPNIFREKERHKR
jgi:hypothetical protein